MNEFGDKLASIGADKWEIRQTKDPGPGQPYYWQLTVMHSKDGVEYGGSIASQDKGLLLSYMAKLVVDHILNRDEVVDLFKHAIKSADAPE